jgi:DNA-binding MarR family transcriptional regulator
MENEFQILDNIEKNKNVTQRDIARNTGMSLGNVNILIKRLVKKGLVKIERLNAKTIRYILTPQGLKAKATETYKYLLYSYKFINEINSKIDELLLKKIGTNSSQVIICGKNDEICEILQKKLCYYNISYIYISTVEEYLKMKVSEIENIECRGGSIISWHPDYVDGLSQNGIECINLLEIV